MDIVSLIIGIVVGASVGVGVYYLFISSKANSILENAKKEAEDIKAKAEKEYNDRLKDLELEKKKLELEVEEYKSQVNKELETKKLELVKKEESLKVNELMYSQKREELEKKISEYEEKIKELQSKEDEIKSIEDRLLDKEKELQQQVETYIQKLETISGFSREEAKQELIKEMEDIARQEGEQRAREIIAKAEEEANKEAKKIIALAIQKTAVDHTVETTVSVVTLPSDEMKGRIIGRTGRNIRTFESVTGVDIIIDDTPEAVVLSSFDPIRRELAKIILEKLIADGRIHPSRIEELAEKAQEELAELINNIGHQTVLELGVVGVHPEIIKLLGKLKFRTSYGQNVLQHSIEVAYLSAFIAAELGLDVEIAKRAGLLHDIGKAVDREYEGTHALIGAELAQKYGENELVVNAIASHHEEVEPISIYSIIVQAADTISASRPGARRETLENYIKRVKKLEEIATSFEGVSKGYAVQAGREVRVIVESDSIDDIQAENLAKDIAKKIEEEMQYPGNIKVNVIRERRFVEYAK